MLAPTGISVRWNTDVAANAKITYGTAPDALTQTLNVATSTTAHDIRITGLNPDTTYYYSVGTSTTPLAGGDATHKFKTAPLPGTVKPVRVWVLGDSGTGGDGTGRAESVRDGYLNSPFYQDPDLWIMLGDNAYNDGTEAETTKAIFQTYPTMLRKSALWSAFGNHEAHTAAGAPYFAAFTFPKNAESGGVASGTENYYSFDFANIHFVCLDSQTSSSRAIGSPMLQWLEADLAATTQPWIIAFWHHPPYSKGSHSSDTETSLIQMRTNALPILEAHGVDLVLCGHSHSYERSMLINGHYGLSSTFNPATMAIDPGNGKETGTGAYQKAPGGNHGTVYMTAGNSGKTSGGLLNHPVMVSNLNVLGSIVLDVDGNRLDVREINSAGTVIDNFTIIKSATGSTLVVQNWESLNTHAGTPRALAISDDQFVEPRAAGLRHLRVTFSEPITVANPASALTVTGLNSAGPLNLGALGIATNVAVANNQLNITFTQTGNPAALPDVSKWRFSLNRSAITGSAGILADTPANSRIVTTLLGDSTGNGQTTALDLNHINSLGTFNPLTTQHLRADINGDATLDSTDLNTAWPNRQQRTDSLPQP
jgi:hypothetical protein